MTRKTFDPDTEVNLPPNGQLPASEEKRRPCLVCSDDTLVATLMNYGGRCWKCYEGYKRAPQPKLGKQIRVPMARSRMPGDDA